MATQLKVKLVKSQIGRPAAQRAVLHGLGLNRTQKTVLLNDTPEIRGMINKVSHLITIEE